MSDKKEYLFLEPGIEVEGVEYRIRSVVNIDEDVAAPLVAEGKIEVFEGELELDELWRKFDHEAPKKEKPSKKKDE